MLLILTSLLIAVAVGLVLEPVFRSPSLEEQAVLPGSNPRRHLEEQREMIYDNVRDLEFEYQAGKLSEDDYQRTRQDYMAEAGGLMAREMGLGGPAAPKGSTAPKGSAAVGEASAAEPRCPQCGFMNPPKMKFCGECGARLGSPAG